MTEEVHGVDLVGWMLRLALGDTQMFDAPPAGRPWPRDPGADLRGERRRARPSAGLLTDVTLPQDVRVDSWVSTGQEVTAAYDPLLAKVIVHAPDRDAALAASLGGPRPDARRRCPDQPRAAAGRRSSTPQVRRVEHTTATLAELRDEGRHARGAQARAGDDGAGLARARSASGESASRPRGRWTTGRFAAATPLVGNDEGAAGLECLLGWAPPALLARDGRLRVRGAVSACCSTGVRCPSGSRSPCRPAASSTSARCRPSACACTCSSPGASTCPSTSAVAPRSCWAASVATAAGPLRDRRRAGARRAGDRRPPVAAPTTAPRFSNEWTLRVLEGPHAAPDFFTAGVDRDVLCEQLGGALQLRAHRDPADRTGPGVGAGGRRRGRPAPLQHPRHAVRGGHRRLHRRHADPPRPGRSEPRGVRLPGDAAQRRALEARPTAAGRHRSLRAR